MKTCVLALATLATVICSGTVATADIITFTETVTASGSLDGSVFNNGLVTLSLTGNTVDITTHGPFPIFVIHSFEPVTVSVAGAGSDTFVGNVFVFSNQDVGGAGFIDYDPNGIADILDISNAAFKNYDLSTAIGPVSGMALFNPDIPFLTASGTFQITSVSGVATFTAVVPESSSLLLLGTGLLGIAGVVRRKLRGQKLPVKQGERAAHIES